MPSSPPVEVLHDDDHERAFVNLTAVGNSHIEAIGGGLPRTNYKLDAWALRELARQAQQAADALEGSDDA